MTEEKKYTKTIISLGAGVQSSAMLIMSDRGLIERADMAIFGDTQAEPDEVYEWLEFLKTKVSIPIQVVTKGNLEDDMFNGKHFASVPFFVKSFKDVEFKKCSKCGNSFSRYSAECPNCRTVYKKKNKIIRVDGSVGMMRRQCTYEYKIAPLQKYVRKEMLGVEKGKRVGKDVIVKMMIGISCDEIQRRKPSREKWIENTWPLIDLGYRRENCIEYVEKEIGRTPPRSACVFCPFHHNREWKRLKETDKKSFSRAIEYEKKLQSQKRWRGQAFLHRSCEPLENVDFSNTNQVDMFGNECEGMCGV